MDSDSFDASGPDVLTIEYQDGDSNSIPVPEIVSAIRWHEQARENVDEWGLQDLETLLLAMQEELGELAKAHLEATHEGGDPERIQAELDDLAALCYQMQWAVDERGESDARE